MEDMVDLGAKSEPGAWSWVNETAPVPTALFQVAGVSELEAM